MNNNSNGTFVAVRFAEESIEALIKFAEYYEVPNLLEPKDYHCTVVYSRKPLNNVPIEKPIEPQWIAYPVCFDVFLSRSDMNEGPDSRCLVLVIYSEEMNERHTHLREVEGASHDYPSYIPHITLSYDIGDYDISKLGGVDCLPQIQIVREYSEELKDEDRRKEDREEACQLEG